MWPSPEGKEGQLAPTPRRCSAGCLKYRHTKGVRELYTIPPHIIIPCAGPVWRCITQLFSILSPQCHQTRIRPSWFCRQMRDSSVKTTSFHSATHILLSSHHWRQRHLWFCVKGRRSNERLADRPLCCKWCRMVRADTE
ncbi:hypothetical protein TNCV_3873971 [Trichonephila clavipes]|nr:hypothetical protein TNCV_3873971 [Trichonephila clavipes]